MIEYRVRECATVTDEELERILNEMVGMGWHLEGIQFAMRDSSKRPAMAFLIFTKVDDTRVKKFPRKADCG
jgi:hypothetical protein